jgi:hypothetical protein
MTANKRRLLESPRRTSPRQGLILETPVHEEGDESKNMEMFKKLYRKSKG